MIFGAAQVRYVDAKSKIDVLTEVARLTPLTTGPVTVDWNVSIPIDLAPGDLDTTAVPGVRFVDVPPNVVKSRSADAWTRDFLAWVYGNQSLDLLRSEQSGVLSKPGESERDFRIRLQHTSREARDAMVEKLRQKYAPKVAAAQERVRRAEQTVSRESEQAQSHSLQTAISFGTTLLGALVGRKAVSMSTLGRATTAARGVGRTLKESQDIGRARETVEAAQQQLEELNARLLAETEALELRFDASSEPLQDEHIKPRKSHITARLVTLVWVPFASDGAADALPAWQIRRPIS